MKHPKSTFTVFTAVLMLSLILAASGFSQTTDTDTAYVPVVVNVANVEGGDVTNLSVSLKVQSPNGGERTYNLQAGKRDTLALPLAGFVSISHRLQSRQTYAPTTISHRRGNVTLRLNPEQFRSADISLLSINGRRVWRGKTDASKSAQNVSLPNVAAGVYLLSVKGINGNTFATKLTHTGGKLNVSVAVGGGDISPIRKSANYADGGTGAWTITAWATQHDTVSREFTPTPGMNQPQIIALPLAVFTLIEKERWGLIADVYSKEAGVHNTNALNLAMRTLLEEGHTKLRLEKGDYCVWGSYADDTPDDYVRPPTNVHLDLNGSTLRLAKNDQPWNHVIRIYDVENVKVFNGTLIGSRNDHDYGNRQGPHDGTFGKSREWADHAGGCGIWVALSKNIELYNLTIKDVTGDGVMIGYASSNVTIRNSDISRARRGGIVAVACDGLVIRDNHIHNIYNDELHFDLNGNVIGIGEEAGIAFEADTRDERITNVLIEGNTIIGNNGAFTDNDKYGDYSSSRLHWTISFSVGTNNVVVRNNEMVGGFRLLYGNNILIKKNTFRNKRPEDASGYGCFRADHPVSASYDFINSENVIIKDNKFDDIVMVISGGWLSESRPNYRKNYVIVGNEFSMTDNWRTVITLETAVNTVVIDNKFSVDKDNWAWQSFATTASHPDVNANPIAFHWIYIRDMYTPPQTDVKYNFYFANNTVDKDSEYIYLKFYALGNNGYASGYGVRENVLPSHPNIPEWYSESINRDEAIEFINSFKWF